MILFRGFMQCIRVFLSAVARFKGLSKIMPPHSQWKNNYKISHEIVGRMHHYRAHSWGAPLYLVLKAKDNYSSRKLWTICIIIPGLIAVPDIFLVQSVNQSRPSFAKKIPPRFRQYFTAKNFQSIIICQQSSAVTQNSLFFSPNHAGPS